MKESEFLELLNLYLDHEISATDAARLEAEVQGNPARRRTYLEYCRMQKACTLLAKDFASETSSKKVIAFEPRRSAWSGAAFGLGGLAVAAACVAFVLVNRTPLQTAPVGGTVAAVSAQPSPVATALAQAPAEVAVPVAQNLAATGIARTVTVQPRHADAKPMFVVAPLAASVTNPDASELLSAAQQNAQAQFEWMARMQLAPLQVQPAGELRLDARSPLQPGNRTYTNGRQIQGEVQMSAFRFQK